MIPFMSHQTQSIVSKGPNNSKANRSGNGCPTNCQKSTLPTGSTLAYSSLQNRIMVQWSKVSTIGSEMYRLEFRVVPNRVWCATKGSLQLSNEINSATAKLWSNCEQTHNAVIKSGHFQYSSAIHRSESLSSKQNYSAMIESERYQSSSEMYLLG